MVYVGLDVHRRRTQVAALDEDGHELFNRNVPNDLDRLGDVLVGRCRCSPKFALSAHRKSRLRSCPMDEVSDAAEAVTRAGR